MITFVGYSEKSLSLDELMNKCNSLGEVQLALDFYVLNNEKILHKLPILKERIAQNDSKSRITLYGDELSKDNALAEEIFNGLPEGKNNDIDIIATENRTIIMMKGLERPLTIDIDQTSEQPEIKFFIPNVPDESSLNFSISELETTPGKSIIGKLKTDSYQNLSEAVYELIDNAPINNMEEKKDTDSIIFYPGEVREFVDSRVYSGVKVSLKKYSPNKKSERTARKYKREDGSVYGE